MNTDAVAGGVSLVMPTHAGNFRHPRVPGWPEGAAFDQRGRERRFPCKVLLALAERHNVLVFQMDLLVEDMEVTGPIQVRLWISFSAVDTAFTAELIDVYHPNEDYRDGYDTNLRIVLSECATASPAGRRE